MSDGLTSRPTPFVCREPLKRFVLQGLPVRVLFLLGFSRDSHLALKNKIKKIIIIKKKSKQNNTSCEGVGWFPVFVPLKG